MTSTIWPVTWPSTTDTSKASPEQIALAEAFAGQALRMLTLDRVGGAPVTVMPDPRRRVSGIHLWDPTLSNAFPGMFWPGPGFGYGSAVYPAADALESSGIRREAIPLPAPVGRVDQVVVDGVVLDPSKYVVENGEWLLRTDGGTWPSLQGPSFTVTYLQGFAVDLMGRYAAGLLAAEFFKAITGTKGCRLPSGVTDIVRQGVTMKLPTGIFDGGQTGITEVDAYVAQWNPNRLRTRPAVYSVDLHTPRQVSWRP